MQRSPDIRSSMQRRPSQPGRIEKARHPMHALGRLLPYMQPYRLRLAAVLVLSILYTLLGLAGPYLMGVAIDRFIAQKDPAGLARVVALMLIVYLFSNLFHALGGWIMAGISQSALKNVRQDLFQHLQKQSMHFFDTNPAGSLMSRLTNDIDAINTAVSQNITMLFTSLLSMLGIVVAMFLLNPWLALGSLLVVPIMLWFASFIASYTRKGFRELQEKLGALNGISEEAISGQKVVKAFRRNESMLKAFEIQNEAVFRASVYANSYSMLLMPVTNVLGNFFVVVLAGLGGLLALQGLVTVGTIATFISYGQNFISPIRQITNLYNTIQAALAGAERVFEILDTPPEIQDQSAAAEIRPIKGSVVLDNVRFSYIKGQPVIKDMSLVVEAGQTIALVGPTGAGKTTITNLLNRFYDVDGGSISIDGVDIRNLRKDELRRSLGLVLQDTFLFADTVMENIRYGRLDATDEECIEAACRAEADHFIRQLPGGYQTNLAERASNLSQGQRQLLAIARVILADPAILILDEATSSVDTRTEVRIQQSLLRLMEGRTSFVIAHRLSTIRDADLVVVIDHGEIVEQGTHQDLLDRKGFYYHLYLSQFKGNAI